MQRVKKETDGEKEKRGKVEKGVKKMERRHRGLQNDTGECSHFIVTYS